MARNRYPHEPKGMKLSKVDKMAEGADSGAKTIQRALQAETKMAAALRKADEAISSTDALLKKSATLKLETDALIEKVRPSKKIYSSGGYGTSTRNRKPRK